MTPTRIPARASGLRKRVKSVRWASANAVIASAGSDPASAERMIAASATDRVSGPAVSCVWLTGTIRVRETSPTVGFRPTRPFTDAGHVMEPSVSVPTAAAARLAAADTPDPELEPHGERSRAYGFRV